MMVEWVRKRERELSWLTRETKGRLKERAAVVADRGEVSRPVAEERQQQVAEGSWAESAREEGF